MTRVWTEFDVELLQDAGVVVEDSDRLQLFGQLHHSDGTVTQRLFDTRDDCIEWFRRHYRTGDDIQIHTDPSFIEHQRQDIGEAPTVTDVDALFRESLRALDLDKRDWKSTSENI